MYKKLREQCCRANLELPKLGLAIYTFGNVSVVDRKTGVFAIKPSGVPYSKMRADDMVIVRIADGKVMEGALRPSSDVNSHLILYRAFPNIGSVVHTHSLYAVSWAQACRPVPVYGTSHADYLSCDIPCTELMADEEIKKGFECGKLIVDYFRGHKLNPDEVPMVLVGGHGPFIWGANATQSVCNARILEELCHMAYLTEQINPQISPLKDTLLDKHRGRKYGKNAYYGQKQK